MCGDRPAGMIAWRRFSIEMPHRIAEDLNDPGIGTLRRPGVLCIRFQQGF